MVPTISRLCLICAGLLCVFGCNERLGETEPRASRPLPSGPAAALPTGDLAGAAWTDIGAETPNPYEGQPAAAAEGQRLFVKMNCAGCHGYGLKGAMGPDLTDRYWRYGGTPAAIYQSIARGRPQGMPAWGKALPPSEIWKIVSYIETFGGTTPPDQYQAGLQGDLPPNTKGKSAPGKG